MFFSNQMKQRLHPSRNVYLLFRNSIRNSKLANNLHKLNVSTTIRNWKTLSRLATLAKTMEIWNVVPWKTLPDSLLSTLVSQSKKTLHGFYNHVRPFHCKSFIIHIIKDTNIKLYKYLLETCRFAVDTRFLLSFK
jgi:hypothetical protein